MFRLIVAPTTAKRKATMPECHSESQLPSLDPPLRQRLLDAHAAPSSVVNEDGSVISGLTSTTVTVLTAGGGARPKVASKKRRRRIAREVDILEPEAERMEAEDLRRKEMRAEEERKSKLLLKRITP